MSPLWHLTLARFREFYREPAALFWVYGFPLILAFTLGLAFGERPVPAGGVGRAGKSANRAAAPAPVRAGVFRCDGGRKGAPGNRGRSRAAASGESGGARRPRDRTRRT